MEFEWFRADVSRIAADETYRITTETALEPLAGSLQSIGLLHPPILAAAKGTYRVVAGFRRIGACRRLGWDRIDARLLPPGTPPGDCAAAAIADNSFARPLNVIELSRAYHLLAAGLESTAAVAAAAATLNLPAHSGFIAKLLRVRRMPAEVQAALLAETIALPTAMDLETLATEEQGAWLAVFERLQLGLNRQRELATLVRDIARRENRTVLQVLQGEPLKTILSDDSRDGPAKTRSILSCLHRRRYPEKTRAEARFAKKLAALKLPRNIQLTPPKNFENGSYGLRLSFENQPDLLRQLETLRPLAARDDFKKLIDADFLFDLPLKRDKAKSS